MEFFEQLQEARRISGLSQEQVAALMNMSRQGISHWENGRAIPDAESVKKLSQVLNYNFVDPIEPTVTQPEAASEADHRSEEQAPPEPLTPPVSSPKRKPILLFAVCLIAGIALGWIVCTLITPQPVPAVSIPGVVMRASVTISAEKNPVLPVYLNEDDPYPYWIYHIFFTETSGVDFTFGELAEIHVLDDGSEIYMGSLSAEQLGFEDGVIPGKSTVSFTGGLPVQEVHSIRFVLSGKDQMQNDLTFEENILLSKDMPE